MSDTYIKKVQNEKPKTRNPACKVKYPENSQLNKTWKNDSSPMIKKNGELFQTI
jgi:hypothetical protein